jgi:hypothetical protein
MDRWFDGNGMECACFSFFFLKSKSLKIEGRSELGYMQYGVEELGRASWNSKKHSDLRGARESDNCRALHMRDPMSIPAWVWYRFTDRLWSVGSTIPRGRKCSWGVHSGDCNHLARQFLNGGPSCDCLAGDPARSNPQASLYRPAPDGLSPHWLARSICFFSKDSSLGPSLSLQALKTPRAVHRIETFTLWRPSS